MADLSRQNPNTSRCISKHYPHQYASLLRFGGIVESCICCQSSADWQTALSVYRPAGKEESKVLIKSGYEVEGIR